MISDMETKEMVEQAFRRIIEDKALYRQWNDAKTDHHRQHLITKQVIGIVAEQCIDEIYANHDDAFTAITNIREKFGVK